MKANIIRIGNSQGIRIPKIILEQTRLGKEVELEVEDQKIVIHPINQPRQGWDKKFKLMAESEDDRMIDEMMPIETQFDRSEWEW
jgi:antitoxin MazE